MVEVPRQNTDLILSLDLNALGKVARGDLPRTEGQRADGRDENLRKKERQNDTDHKTESQRAQDDGKELARERVDRCAAV